MKRLITNLSAMLLGIVILISGGLLFRSIDDTNAFLEEDSEVKSLEFIGEYSLDGEVFEPLSRNTNINIRKDETIVLRGHFNETIKHKDILFTVKNFKFLMKVNDKPFAEYGREGTYPPFLKSAGFTRFMQPILYLNEKDVVEIELTYPYNRGGRTAFYEFINEISVGNKASFYSMYVTKYILPFFMVATIILIGFFSLIASIILRLWKEKNGLKVIFSALFVTAGGIWFFMDTFYVSANIIMPYAVILNILDMVNLLLLPIFATFFLGLSFKNVKTIIISNIVKVVQLGSVGIILMQQFCGIVDLYESQTVSIPINAIACLIIIICAFYELFVYKNKEIKSVLAALVPTIIGAYSDIITNYSDPKEYQYIFRSGFFISCCIILISSVKQYKESIETKKREEKLKRELTNSKVAIMLSQIQPHFLYNALNAIQYICMEDSHKASKAIEHFSKYLRGNMDSLKQQELIPFKKELEHLGNYLYIEHLRFGERVKVKYDLQVTDFLVPSLVVQPIVENAIRYGITKKLEGGTVEIKTEEDESHIIIKIVDDGKGFDPQNINEYTRSHIGIDNVRNRLKLQCNGTLELKSAINMGTSVTIKIPKEGVMIL